MTPEEEKKISEATERIRQQQEAEQRGTTAKDFRDMAAKNKDVKPYQQVDPIGVNPASAQRVLLGAWSTALGAAQAISRGVDTVSKTAAGGTSAPAFSRPRKQTANIYRYGGIGSGGGGRPDFVIGQNPVIFSNGGSTVNTAHLHGFGAMQPGGMFGSLYGLSAPAFGMVDGRLNFTQSVMAKNQKSGKKKGKK